MTDRTRMADCADHYIAGYRAGARAPLDVERLARALPQVMTQEECDEVYAVGTNPLDVPYEWFTTPRELATDIANMLRSGDAPGGSDVRDTPSGNVVVHPIWTTSISANKTST